MDEGGLDDPNRRGQAPTWGEKVLRLADELQARHLPYAFGGAIALNYHREPRSTLDIDINVFVKPEDDDPLVEALSSLYGLEGQERSLQELRQDGQTRTTWGSTFVDLFLANTDFHLSMAERVERQPFGDQQIPVLTIEDLLICKVLFDRPKDWIDIEAVGQTRTTQLDSGYIQHWLKQFLEPGDPRFSRVRQASHPIR